ncbi:hypothetical protein [Brachybacterium massiliense]|uniref:hypothetical protein n=1 Tax=Brachybacterium massiliense TaxID=1755098 RepID=UPI000B3BCA56|nr:hypothetical protein [Brachybacterium massiliense]
MDAFSWCEDDDVSIEWAGIEFSSRHDRFEYPKWKLRETDWFNGSADEPEKTRAPRGMWAGASHFASRTVSWSGILECESSVELVDEMRALQGARGDSLKVWEVDVGRQAVCEKVQTQITRLSDRFARYSVVVVLDDPLISSIDELSLAPSRAVTNHGAVRARPVVSVTAPGQRPTVTIGSWSTRAPRNLGAGEVFTVDCRTETIYLGGSAVFPILPAFPSIRPGATATISTSHGTGTVDGVSAWI